MRIFLVTKQHSKKRPLHTIKLYKEVASNIQTYMYKPSQSCSHRSNNNNKKKLNIIWFNPHFSEHVDANIREKFSLYCLNISLQSTDTTKSSLNKMSG